MRGGWSFIILSIFSCSVTGQSPEKKIYIPELIFSKNHFSFSLLAGVTSKATITANAYNNYNIGSSPQVAFETGVNYYYSINKKYSLIIGLHSGCIVRNFEYYIHKEEFSPPYGGDVFSNKGVSRGASFYIKVPVIAERRYFQKEKSFLNTQIGISLVYTFLNEETEDHSIVYNNGQVVRFLHIELIPNNNRKPWLNYLTSVGYSWTLKNKNLFSLNLTANFSFTNFVTGFYKIEIPGKPIINGNYSVNGSYLGLSGTYIFTKARKKIRGIHLKEPI